jgi:hypothetical protein
MLYNHVLVDTITDAAEQVVCMMPAASTAGQSPANITNMKHMQQQRPDQQLHGIAAVTHLFIF